MRSENVGSNITVYGHRGARGIYPENTIAGFQYLYDIGGAAVEMDVQNAAGRVPVVTHDPHVTMPVDGHAATRDLVKKSVRETSLEELATALVAGHKSNGAGPAPFPDQAQLPKARIPTFEVFCEWAAAHAPMVLNVEIKSHAVKSELFDPPQIIVPDVLEILERHNLMDRCVLSSFDWRILNEAAQRAPDLVRGYLTLERTHGSSMEPNIIDGSPWMNGETRADHSGSLPKTIAALGGKFWCPYYKDLTQDTLHMAQDLGLEVNVWTVNAIADIHQMIDMGVNGIITDYPARAENILAQRGQR